MRASILALCLFAVGCSGESTAASPSTGAGGNDGGIDAETDSSTEGGADASEDADGDRAPTCPNYLPSHADSCSDPLVCEYESNLDRCPERAATATCAGGAWQVVFPAACSPLESTATCDPFGEWQLLDLPVDEPCGTPAETFLIAQADDGAPTVSWHDLETASISGDGCSLALTAGFYYTGVETGGTTWELSLTINGDSASGELFCQESGLFDGTYRLPVTAQRIAP